VTIFENMPLKQALSDNENSDSDEDSPNQLVLFD
jgi:hypothetical protein